jgi:DNA-binding NarL/FixJ family response regulator
VIRVLLLEDHAVFREALALALGFQPDVAVVGQAGTLAEARLCLSGVDVAVFDLDLPDGNGADLIAELHAASPLAQVLVLTASGGRMDLAKAVERGAAAVLHKTTPLAEIIDAVRRLSAGEFLMDQGELVALMRLASRQRVQERAAEQALGRLTARERDVLQALGDGLSDKEIAERLSVSKDTVHTHMVNLLGKLGVESRLQALIVAVRHGLITLT